ncbi:MAG: zf-HC2 domain-containing protein, partial [Clostridiales bacterium]|nr:zf-HC2 domain-containing protein [Clostridiales bacterium]
MKFTCEEAREKLSEYIDEIANGEEQAALQAHISTCGDCADTCDGLRTLIRELNTLPPEPLPPGFQANFRKRLSEEAKPPRRFSVSRRWRGYSALAAGLLFLVLIRAGYYNNFHPVKTAYVDDAALEIAKADNAAAVPKTADSTPEETIPEETVPAEAARNFVRREQHYTEERTPSEVPPEADALTAPVPSESDTVPLDSDTVPLDSDTVPLD